METLVTLPLVTVISFCLSPLQGLVISGRAMAINFEKRHRKAKTRTESKTRQCVTVSLFVFLYLIWQIAQSGTSVGRAGLSSLFVLSEMLLSCERFLWSPHSVSPSMFCHFEAPDFTKVEESYQTMFTHHRVAKLQLLQSKLIVIIIWWKIWLVDYLWEI